ncbi:MAG: hypothetical protein UY05_C0039G0008 [Candidatus Peregrinibacteria bacterium GW2011_GWA2_47_7]|nr:MAG: hypothetical protein UY05_C0039G0008 [Candidatus Peregrinibacteria bacterium GW2011_GWA2_47_7]
MNFIVESLFQKTKEILAAYAEDRLVATLLLTDKALDSQERSTLRDNYLPDREGIFVGDADKKDMYFDRLRAWMTPKYMLAYNNGRAKEFLTRLTAEKTGGGFYFKDSSVERELYSEFLLPFAHELKGPGSIGFKTQDDAVEVLSSQEIQKKLRVTNGRLETENGNALTIEEAGSLSYYTDLLAQNGVKLENYTVTKGDYGTVVKGVAVDAFGKRMEVEFDMSGSTSDGVTLIRPEDGAKIFVSVDDVERFSTDGFEKMIEDYGSANALGSSAPAMDVTAPTSVASVSVAPQGFSLRGEIHTRVPESESQRGLDTEETLDEEETPPAGQQGTQSFTSRMVIQGGAAEQARTSKSSLYLPAGRKSAEKFRRGRKRISSAGINTPQNMSAREQSATPPQSQSSVGASIPRGAPPQGATPQRPRPRKGMGTAAKWALTGGVAGSAVVGTGFCDGLFCLI